MTGKGNFISSTHHQLSICSCRPAFKTDFYIWKLYSLFSLWTSCDSITARPIPSVQSKRLQQFYFKQAAVPLLEWILYLLCPAHWFLPLSASAIKEPIQYLSGRYAKQHSALHRQPQVKNCNLTLIVSCKYTFSFFLRTLLHRVVLCSHECRKYV